MQKMNMLLYLLNFSKFISYHSLRSLEVIANSLFGCIFSNKTYGFNSYKFFKFSNFFNFPFRKS